MSICLCNLSADAVLERVAQKQMEIVPASPNALEFLADPAAAKEGLNDLVDKLPEPLELLVGDASRRRKASDVVCHVWRSPLPRNSVLAVREGVYVSSPEFTLLQQASQLHQANLCQMLGRYLGAWTPKADEPFGLGERAPLTSFDSLHGFLMGVGHAPGKSNLRLAMAYTCEGAASPPETTLQLALCLPPLFSGLGILPPTMNHKVMLSTPARRLYPHESIRIDLCWRHKRFGLEYQGEGHESQLDEDYARWFAAREEGYELWFVAKEQLANADQMLHIGREVARRIDADVDESLWPTSDEFQDLLDTLAGRRHPKPMTQQELRERKTKLRIRSGRRPTRRRRMVVRPRNRDLA